MTTFTATPQQVERVIAAVFPHAADDRHIPMLTCINLELDGDRFVAVATDRYTLGVCWASLTDWATDAEPSEPISVRIFAADLRRLFAFLRVHRKIPANWELTGGLTVTTGSESLTVRTVDVEFPRWRKILGDLSAKHADKPIPAMRFGTPMVEAFAQSAKVLNEPGMTWHLGGEHTDAPVIQIGDSFIGLLMPQRIPELLTLDLSAIGIEAPKAVAA